MGGLRTATTIRRPWWAVRVAAAMLVLAAVLAVVTRFETVFVLVAGPSMLALAALGAHVVVTRPELEAGRLLLWGGTLACVSFALRQVTWFAHADRGLGLDATQWLIVAGDWTFQLWVLALLLLLLRFPDGRLPGRSWRLVEGALFVATTVALVGIPVVSMAITDPRAFLLDPTLVGQDGASIQEVHQAIVDVFGLVFLLVSTSAIAGLVVRLRASTGSTRRRIAAVVYGAIAWLVGFLLGSATSLEGVAATIRDLATGLGFAWLAAALWFALSRQGLWDVQLVVRRSVVHALLWSGIAVGYVAVAAGLGLAAGARLPVEVAIVLTVVATIVVQPARTRLERLVDRHVLGRTASAAETVHGFARRVRDAGTDDRWPEHLAEAAAALGLAHVRVVVDGHVAAEAGDDGDGPVERFPLSAGRVDEAELVCQAHAGTTLDREQLAVLSALATLAGLALANRRLAARIVTAHEHERRRIERNLHDGAQQQLIGLAAQVSLLRGRTAAAGEQVDAALDQLAADVMRTLTDLRALAQGIHPTVLTDGGIAEAVEDLCSRQAVPVRLHVDQALRTTRFPDDTEGAVYFAVAEAIANALKHADPTTLVVELGHDDDSITATVSDDGHGFDADAAKGSGLDGLGDRLDALGGSLDLTSVAGRGTTVAARLPAAPVGVGVG